MPGHRGADDFGEPVDVQARATMLNTDFKTPSAGLSKRANRSKFKIHVVNAAAKVLGIIIIIDYNINPSSEKQETISASFEKLTNMKTKGKVVAT
ncbi:hypothetical protein CFRS1_v007725 [Colletotrichum fructicola]|nr:hypothetical protein CFRS1_v007725 [Colletotrichum fructicola]